jgi:pectinesterase
MKDWNIYTETHQFNIQVHPFWLLDPWVDQTVNFMDSFLMKVFKE